ncbi:MAG: hypothetical protein DRG09_06645 [Epsilonproteobacteria bacterium]|nr:MAG: hypothetical protein DRG09_06645 [Campylobacterota bacterium]
MINDEEIYARYLLQFKEEGIADLFDQVNTQAEAAIFIYANKHFKQSILDAPPKHVDTNTEINEEMTYQFYMRDLRWTIEAFFRDVTDDKSAKKLTKTLMKYYLKE